MKIEVGKTYRSRCGHVVKIIWHQKGHPLPFIGDDKCGYRPDGGYLPPGNRHLFGDQTPESERHEYDLIEQA